VKFEDGAEVVEIGPADRALLNFGEDITEWPVSEIGPLLDQVCRLRHVLAAETDETASSGEATQAELVGRYRKLRQFDVMLTVLAGAAMNEATFSRLLGES